MNTRQTAFTFVLTLLVMFGTREAAAAAGIVHLPSGLLMVAAFLVQLVPEASWNHQRTLHLEEVARSLGGRLQRRLLLASTVVLEEGAAAYRVRIVEANHRRATPRMVWVQVKLPARVSGRLTVSRPAGQSEVTVAALSTNPSSGRAP